MSIERRLQALESRLHEHRHVDERRLSMTEMDLVLASFDPSDRVLTEAERREARRLIATCASDLSDSELDHQLELFVDDLPPPDTRAALDQLDRD